MIVTEPDSFPSGSEGGQAINSLLATAELIKLFRKFAAQH